MVELKWENQEMYWLWQEEVIAFPQKIRCGIVVEKQSKQHFVHHWF